MSQIGAAWAAMSSAARTVAVGGLLLPVVLVGAVAVTAIGVAPGRTTAPAPSPDPLAGLPTDAPPSATPTPSPLPLASGSASPAPASPTPGPTRADPLLGKDGRLTVLLLGSDYRPAHPGNRTDAIMVVSVDPTSGKTAAFSIPRDVVDFPLPTGGVYRPKVNGLYQYLQAKTGRGAANMMKAVGRAFDIEVDNFVFIGFAGVQELVAAVGGVDVRLAKAYYDPYYWVNGHHRGWGLPAGKSHLNAASALIFARSRKGDSDFGRARRQQMLVMAAFDKVRKRGIDDLPKLIKAARDTVRTDLPLSRMKDLFTLFAKVDLGKAHKVVFGPKTYAVRAHGYDYDLVFAKCKAWIRKYFPTKRPFAAWPPVAAPSRSVAPGATPAASGQFAASPAN